MSKNKELKFIDIKQLVDTNCQAIGVFDSGVGGLTVVRELMSALPSESILYFGDTLRCPYGKRSLDEIKSFACQITAWMLTQDVKMVVIACNSATAAALSSIQHMTKIPVIGVVDAGARAAHRATNNGRVGVIGTDATVNSAIYTKAIKALDTQIEVFSAATAQFVDIVELDLRHSEQDIVANENIARQYLEPLKAQGIDTLVLGCTHFPLLAPLITKVLGPGIKIISSADETAADVADILSRLGKLAPIENNVEHRFVTTATDISEFALLGAKILSVKEIDPICMPLVELESLSL